MELQRRLLANIPDQLDEPLSLVFICNARFHRTKKLTNLKDEIEYHFMALVASVAVCRSSASERCPRSGLLHDSRRRRATTRCCLDTGKPALSLRGQMSRFEPPHTLAVHVRRNSRTSPWHSSSSRRARSPATARTRSRATGAACARARRTISTWATRRSGRIGATSASRWMAFGFD
jgi:hypothetical protein